MDTRQDEIREAMNAIKERLADYRESERDIENKTEMLERLKSKLEGMGAREISDMPRSPSPPKDRISDLLSQKIEVEAEIEEAVAHRKEERCYIEGILKHIKGADEKGVIRFRYLLGMDWTDVTNALFGAKSDYLDKEGSYLRRTTKLHGRAIYSMASYAANCK